MEERKRKKHYPRMMLALALVVVCIGGIFLEFFYRLNQNLKDQMGDQLLEIASQSLDLLKNKLDDAFFYMNSLAGVLAGYDGLRGNEAFALLQAQQREGASFIRLSVVDADGTSYAPNGETVFVGDRPYFKSAMAGKNAISDVATSRVDEETGVVLAVPIYKGGRVAGVLRCDYHMDAFSGLFQMDAFGGKGTIHLIKADGTIFSPSPSLAKYNTYFSALYEVKLKNGKTVQEVKDDLKAGRQGILVFDYSGTEQYVAYVPVQINGWYLLVSTTVDAISGRITQITKLVVSLTVKVVFVLLLLGLYLIYLQHKNTRRVRQSQRELNALTANIPGGVQCFHYDEALTIAYASSGFYELTGFSQEEAAQKFGNRLTEIIYPADRLVAIKRIRSQLDQKKRYEAEYRIHKKGGELLWVLDKGQLVEEGKRAMVYSVLVDITATKNTLQQLQISEARYRAIMEKSDSVIFEWNIERDTASFSDIWEKKFGYPPVRTRFLEDLGENRITVPADTKSILELFGKVAAGERYAEAVLRLRREPGSYIWCRVCLTGIVGNDGKTVRAVGVTLDVDKEKREAEVMQEKAQRDSLTKLYNKGTTQALVTRFIEGEGANEQHAFIIIDIDNFKAVNDNLGHHFGDTVLADVAAKVAKSFRSDDVVGRIGGDEFAVFLKNVRSETQIAQKAEDICRAFRNTYTGEKGDYNISCSVGIALYGRDGTTYDELYQRADAALYTAKRSGKNRYRFFESHEPVIPAAEDTPGSPTGAGEPPKGPGATADRAETSAGMGGEPTMGAGADGAQPLAGEKNGDRGGVPVG